MSKDIPILFLAEKVSNSLIFKQLQDKLSSLKVLCIFATKSTKTMALFDKIFGSVSSEEKPKINWILLTNISQLDKIATSENTSTIFKHSTRCFTSKIVLSQFQKHFNIDATKVDMYFLDLLVHRAISNEIENRFDVYHESPQIIVIKNNKAVANASHSDIVQLNLEQYI